MHCPESPAVAPVSRRCRLPWFWGTFQTARRSGDTARRIAVRHSPLSLNCCGRTAPAHHSRHRPVAVGTISAFVKHLPVVVKRHAPAIRAGHAASKNPSSRSSRGRKPPHGRTIQPHDTRRLHSRHRVQPLREPKTTVRPVADAVHELMRVANAKPRKKHAPHIGSAVPVGILQVQ